MDLILEQRFLRQEVIGLWLELGRRGAVGRLGTLTARDLAKPVSRRLAARF